MHQFNILLIAVLMSTWGEIAQLKTVFETTSFPRKQLSIMLIVSSLKSKSSYHVKDVFLHLEVNVIILIILMKRLHNIQFM